MRDNLSNPYYKRPKKRMELEMQYNSIMCKKTADKDSKGELHVQVYQQDIADMQWMPCQSWEFGTLSCKCRIVLQKSRWKVKRMHSAEFRDISYIIVFVKLCFLFKFKVFSSSIIVSNFISNPYLFLASVLAVCKNRIARNASWLLIL